MSDNNNKKNAPIKYETLQGKLVYCFIHKPDSGNAAENIDPAYKTDVVLDNPDELKKAKALGLNVKDANEKHSHPFVVVKSKVEEGREPPKIVDTQRNPIPPNILIGNGSEAIVRFLPWGYGKGKVTAILKEIMVVDLVKYEPTPEEMQRKGFLPPLEKGFVVGSKSEPVA